MIVVVGGGLTGLAIGRELHRTGADFLVLEASERAGGVIRSTEVRGHVLDWGPQRARLTSTFQALVEELGLDEELLVAPRELGLLVHRNGQLRRAPLSLRELAGSDLVSNAGKLRLLLEPLTRGPLQNEPVASYFRRKLGSEVYDALVGPLFGGLYASDPAEMDVDTALRPFLDRAGVRRSLMLRLLRHRSRAIPPACSFVSGMETLPRALGAMLEDRLRLRAAVTDLERSGSRWQVEVNGGPERVESDQVVVTTPASAASEILSRVAPVAAAAIGRLRYNPLAVVHLEADVDIDAMGFQVDFSEPRRALRGVTFQQSLFGRTGLCTAFLGGAFRPDVADMPDDRIAELTTREFASITGVDAATITVGRTSMPAWDSSWTELGAFSLPSGVHVAGSWRSRPGIPGRFEEAAQIGARVGGGVEASSSRSTAGRSSS